MKRSRYVYDDKEDDENPSQFSNDDSPPSKLTKEDNENETTQDETYQRPIGALLVAGYGDDQFITYTFDQLPERNIKSFRNSKIKNNIRDDDENMKKYLKIPSHNLLKQIPSEILLDFMFFMDKNALFNFIQTCRGVYELFDQVYGESVERLRLDILNGKRDVRNVNRLIDLFSNNLGDSKTMMTYDQYYRMKSTVKWPSSYFHDHVKFHTYKIGDPMIDVINEHAYAETRKFQNMSKEEFAKIRQDDMSILPYGIFTQPDTYYLTFDEFVKRRCCLANDYEGDDPYDRYYDGFLKVDCVILPKLYDNDSFNWLSSNLDCHYYVDQPLDKLHSHSERIVRFFKNPYEMTFTDFQDRFKNEVLKNNEFARILLYECAFEYNRTTKTRERFIISGGSLLHTLTGCGFSDFDIFVINNGESDEIVSQAIKQVLLKLEEKTQHLTYNIMSSKVTINICQEGKENIQIVLLKYDSIEELLLFFDLDCCKLAYDGEKVFTVLECLRSLKYKINFLHRESGGTSEVHHKRALKYGKRGFLTIVADSFHPLSHAMHCNFIVESIRKSIVEKYAEQIRTEIEKRSSYNPTTDFMNHYRFNPTADLFVSMNSGIIRNEANNPQDLDESNLLYPVILKNISFKFVDECISNGVIYAVHSTFNNNFSFAKARNPSIRHETHVALESEAEAEKEVLTRLKLDEYEFVKRPSDLFQILPENHNLVRAKYSYSHLVCKYSIVHCQCCSNYFYSPFASQLLREQRNVKKLNGHIIPLVAESNKNITQENYNPNMDTLCLSCLKQLNCFDIYNDLYLEDKYRYKSNVENEIEIDIVQSMYKMQQVPMFTTGINVALLYEKLSNKYSLSDLEFNLKILKFKGLVIVEKRNELEFVKLTKYLPIKTFSNQVVVPIPKEQKQTKILDFFNK